ncbi:hypothetical protein LCGC14_2739930, partial [marine sediment metagenome]
MALPVFQATGSQAQANGTSATVSWPTHQADDIGLLIVQTSNSPVTLGGAGAGDWTLTADSPQGTGTENNVVSTRLTAYWARATGSSQSDVTIVADNNVVIGGIFTVRGCITTGDPWDVTAGDVEAATDTANVVVPGDTTTVVDCLIAAIFAHGIDDSVDVINADWTNGDLASFTQRVEYQTPAGKGGGLSVATGGLATAGAYGTSTVSMTSNHTQGRISIALRPPVVGSA